MALTSIATAILNVIGLKKAISSSASDIDDVLFNRDKVKTISASGNIHDLLNNVVIEPVIVPTKKVLKSPVYDKVVDANIDLFGVYYTEAFNSLNNIRGFGLEQTLNLLSSKRYSGTLDAISTIAQAVRENEMVFLPLDNIHPTLEADKHEKHSTTIVRKLSLKGRIDSDKEANINLTIVVAGVVKEVAFNQITSMLTDKTVKNSLSYWYDEWRSGGTSLWNLIFGTMMVKEYHQAVFKNEKDFEHMVEERVKKANRQLLVDGSIGFSKLYQMMIITADEAVLLEKATGLYFHKAKDMEKLLDKTKSFSITVLDDDAELASTYLGGLRNPIETSYKKLSKKKDDMQLADFARILSTRSL